MFKLKPTPIVEMDSEDIQGTFFKWERTHEREVSHPLEKVHAWEDYFLRFA